MALRTCLISWQGCLEVWAQQGLSTRALTHILSSMVVLDFLHGGLGLLEGVFKGTQGPTSRLLVI